MLALGPKKAGKTTLALAALRTGGRIVSDDWLEVRADDAGALAVLASRSFLMLRDGSLTLLPSGLRPLLREVRARGERRWCLKREDAREVFMGPTRVDVLMSISVDRRRVQTVWKRLSHAEVLAAIAAATSATKLMRPVDRAGTPVFALATRLANTCRGSRVWLGRDLLEEPVEVFRNLLRAVTATNR